MKRSTHSFDLDYRPRTYFWPLGLKPHPLSSIKGANRRSLIASALAEDLDADIPRVLLQPALPEPLRQYLGSLHPSGMGGEYLPDLIPGEVEIARITIASVTQDVTCVYARQVENGVFLRVVDEYDGGTLSSKRGRKFTEPPSLGKLARFFLHAYSSGRWYSGSECTSSHTSASSWLESVRALARSSSSLAACSSRSISTEPMRA